MTEFDAPQWDRYAVSHLEARDLWVLHHATYEKAGSRWLPISSGVVGTYPSEDAARSAIPLGASEAPPGLGEA